MKRAFRMGAFFIFGELMTTPFLERIYKQYADKDLSCYCFVFPTRRAGYIFRQQFIKHQNKATWLPEILGIRDFILKIHPVPVADDVILLLKLYNILRSHGMQESLEKFLPWGKIILNDFNEIDQNLVNAHQLYQQSYEERQIDQAFSLSPEEMQEVAGFWKLFATMPLSTLQENFLASWKLLPQVYNQFNDLLKEEQITYEGRAYRETAFAISEKNCSLPWEKIVFCGFYALSNSEQKIFESLKEQGLAEIFWDSDSFYFENAAHEAGLYLRRNPLLKDNFTWNEAYFKSIEKDIYITGVPLRTGQVKWMAQVLLDKLKDPNFNPQKSVIVLPDENMLTALLYSLPEELQAVNVTMGYPAKNSIAASLINSFIELHLQSVSDKTGTLLVRKLIKDLLNRISSTSDTNLHLFLNADIYPLIPIEKIVAAAEPNGYLFSEIKSINQIQLSLQKLLLQYRNKLKPEHGVELAVCNHVLEELKHFFELISPVEGELSPVIVLNMLSEHLNTLKVPFTGEPVQGIQVMGFLETRTLDFENVFILSVNETLLPAKSSGKTYLPYSIRKAFRLPLRTEQDAVYSYHFYRLLQRAREVHLIYNTEPKSLSGGEISRFILQISMELNEQNGFPVKIHQEAVSTEALMQEVPEITIYKDEAIMQKLRDLYILKKSGSGLSATALSDYVSCSLRFYFKYIAGLRTPDEDPEELDAAMFGKVFHSAISKIYSNTKLIRTEDKKKHLELITDSLKDAVREEFKKEIHNGNDYLLKSVLHELLQRIVSNDADDAPLELIGHEKDYDSILLIDNAGPVVLYGKIDRIEVKDEVWRIIDYKTGNDLISESINMEDIFSDPKKKVMLQLLFYSWLVKQTNTNIQIKAGMYKLRNVNQGVKWLLAGNIISTEVLKEFETALKQVISGIFEEKFPFSQTVDRKRCEYCDFINICGRN